MGRATLLRIRSGTSLALFWHSISSFAGTLCRGKCQIGRERTGHGRFHRVGYLTVRQKILSGTIPEATTPKRPSELWAEFWTQFWTDFRQRRRAESIWNVVFMVFGGFVLGGLMVIYPPFPQVLRATFGPHAVPMAMLFSSVTVAALTLVIWRAYRVIIIAYFTVFVSLPSLGLFRLSNNDWALVHSWGWVWVAVTLVPLDAAGIAELLVRFGLIFQIPDWIVIVSVLFALAGAMVSCTLLREQLGEQLAGEVGRECGLWGGLFSPLLAWITIIPFYSERSGKRSWAIRTAKQWMGLLVSVGLANAGVLWLLMAK